MGQLLLQAVLRAAAELELNRTPLARVLGKDRSTLNRTKSMPWARRSERWIEAFEYLSTEITADHTTFLCHEDGKLHRFGRELFLIDGAFPGAAD
jgi:hypothetical protein